VRTLVISDLHLGSLLERDVARRPAALAILEDAVAEADRLVLLGDTLELLEGRPQRAMAAARPVLQRLGAALGRGGEAVVVAGNHDHALVRPWLARRLAGGGALRPATQLPRSASPALAELAGWPAPARVEVRYPGVWLAEGVYATHGHYLDRLLGAALRGRLQDPAAVGRARAEDFERTPGADAGALEDVLAAILPDGMGEGAGEALGQARRSLLGGLPLLATLPGARGVAAAGALVLEQGVHRRGAIPAMAEVIRRLRLPARDVVFGHIHRRGPLPEDPADLWRPRGDAGPALWNSGSWVWDSALVGAPGRPRPYRPGGAVELAGGGAPRVLDLLSGVPDRVLRGRI